MPSAVRASSSRSAFGAWGQDTVINPSGGPQAGNLILASAVYAVIGVSPDPAGPAFGGPVALTPH
jgi:hypothetical protein